MPEDNKTSMWGIIIVVLLVLLFFVFLLVQNNNATTVVNQNSNTTTETTDDTDEVVIDETEEMDPITISVLEQNGSGQAGSLTLEDVDGEVRATLTLTGAPATAQPAHIHTGSCPTPGAIVFDLADVVNGESVTTIDSSLAEMKDLGEIAVNVHKSESELDMYVSCGDIVI